MKNALGYLLLTSIIALVYIGIFINAYAFDVLAVIIVGVFLSTLSDRPN